MNKGIIDKIQAIRKIIKIVDKHDDVAIEILEALSFLLPENIKKFVEVVTKKEKKTIKFLLEILEEDK